MARIDDLLRRIPDAQLRADLTTAIAEVRRTRDFGLVYESHLPETCRLYSHPIRRGVKAAMRSADDGALYLVASVDGPTAKLVPLRDADGLAIPADDQVPIEMPVEDIVVVAEFGDPIHPGLKRVGSLDRGGDKPAHVVINAENHHALEALQFTHAGKVDCIYIDPPYNTGARDWKYNNDYVDANDTYRHSKWLAMMERRLRLAKRLLNAEHSVLIVTIDEREGHRLALLLEQVFPGGVIQMVASVVNRKAVPRSQGFARADEYLLFVLIGNVGQALHVTDMLSSKPDRRADGDLVTWVGLRRRGSEWRRADRPASFFPIFVDASTGSISAVGSPLGPTEDRSVVPDRDGCLTVWPLNSRGEESRWQLSPENVLALHGDGFLRSSLQRGGGVTIEYLSAGQRQQIISGEIVVEGRDAAGAVVVRHVGAKVQQAKSVWNQDSHGATAYGTQLLSGLLPGRRFPFPKSLYAVEDATRFFVADKPDAVVLDFFAGSGTTAHALMRLNRQDGGRRQSILITNNEVSVDEAKALTEQGYYVGDPEWEAQGIFEHVTRPRIAAAVTGRTPDGEPVKGDYKFVDELPMADGFEENVEFFELTYQDAAAVELDLAFEAVAPLLWLRAGGRGAMIEHHDEAGFAWTERYGVLWDTDRWQPFVAAAPETATTTFIVTDSATAFAAVTAELPAGVEPVRLYENYLTTFTINQTEPA